MWMGHAGVVLGVVPCSDYLPGVGDYMKRGLIVGAVRALELVVVEEKGLLSATQ